MMIVSALISIAYNVSFIIHSLWMFIRDDRSIIFKAHKLKGFLNWHLFDIFESQSKWHFMFKFVDESEKIIQCLASTFIKLRKTIIPIINTKKQWSMCVRVAFHANTTWICFYCYFYNNNIFFFSFSFFRCLIHSLHCHLIWHVFHPTFGSVLSFFLVNEIQSAFMLENRPER